MSAIGAELWGWGSGPAVQSSGGGNKAEFMSAGEEIDVHRVCYAVYANDKKKVLLDDVSFRLEPGDMCALMGPSGAGKSTLLDLIAARKHTGIWSGEISINGRPRSPFFGRESAYVLQSDVHIPVLTVRETLRYAALFRMPDKTTRDERDRRVNAIAHMLSLDGCIDSIVGDAMIKGISGGQLKRLSIGVEIINLPSLIFLDEPTSGLDSAISFEVMNAVRNLANQHRTIITTIHQPSPQTFALFDKVVLLAAGKLVYAGPSDEATQFFSQPALGYDYDPDTNPADYIIEVAGGTFRAKNDRTPIRTPHELADIFEQSNYFRTPTERSGVYPEAHHYDRKHATVPLTQFKNLMARSWLTNTRRKDEIKTNLIKNISVGILIVVIFYQQGNIVNDDDTSGSDLFDLYGQPTSDASNVASLLFFAMMYCVMGNLQAIPQLCNNGLIYRRELDANAYSTLPYYFCNAIVQVPFIFFFHMLFVNISFWSIDFDADKFSYFMWNTFLTNLVSFYFAQFLAAACGTSQIALAVFPVTFLFMSNFAGFSIQVPNIPEGWAWASPLSYPRWSYEGLMVNEFETYQDSEQFLDDYGFDNFNKDDSFGYLLMFGFIFGLLTYYNLRPLRSTLLYCQTRNSFLEDSEPPAKFPLLALIRKALFGPPKKQAVDKGLSAPLIGKGEEKSSSAAAGSEKPTGAYGERWPSRSTYDVEWYRKSTGDATKFTSRGTRLTFLDVEYSVQLSDTKELKILRGVSGRVHPGEMCALMGASGAGKSTLLDVIAARKSKGTIIGRILFNGQDPTAAIMRQTAYVMQDNVHISVLTVRETLMYAAQLRMESRTDAGRLARVVKIIDMLGLQVAADTIVGDETVRGVSGGQLKRLSIGVEIINLPDMIFLDEPTTGLDSAISFEVMAAVRNLANQNRTIMTTIHQPSPQTFELFDKLLLMAKGKVIYFGPGSEVVKFFVTCPFQFNYVRGSNPADFCISVAGGFIPAVSGETPSSDALVDQYAKCELMKQFQQNIETMILLDKAAVTLEVPSTREYPRGSLEQVAVLSHRQVIKTVKQRRPTVLAFLRHILVSLFFGSLYWKMKSDQVSDRLSLCFFSLLFMVLGHQQVMPIIFEERLLFYRERGAKAYSTFAYWICSIVMILPMTVINVFVYSSILYPMGGLNDAAGCFGFFYFCMLLTSVVGFFICQFIAAVTPSAPSAVAAFPAVLFLFIGFAGFIVRIPSLQLWIRWMCDVSFMRWSFQGLVLNEFDGNGYIQLSPIPSQEDQAYDEFVGNLGFDGFDKWHSVPVLLANAIIFRVLTFLALKMINYEER